jgi:hypothetical protein
MVSGVPIAMAMVVPGIAGSQLLNNVWQTYAGLAGIADPVRTRPRRNHLRKKAPKTLNDYGFRKNFGSLAGAHIGA